MSETKKPASSAPDSELPEENDAQEISQVANDQAESTRALQKDSGFQLDDRSSAKTDRSPQEQQASLGLLQRTLTSLPDVIFSAGLDGTTMSPSELLEFKTELKEEQKEGQFGSSTQEALKRYTQWLEDTGCKRTLKQLESMKLSFPSDDVPPFKSESATKLGLGSDLSALARSSDLTLDLGIKTDAIPTQRELLELQGAANWFIAGQSIVKAAILTAKDKELNDLIGTMGLPDGWKQQADQDPARWRKDADRAVDLVGRTRNYIESMDSLSKAARFKDFDATLPEGTTIERDNDGNIKVINLDLPKDLNLGAPSKGDALDRLEAWLTKNGEKVNQALSEYYKFKIDPNSVVSWEDFEVHGVKGRFDEELKFLGIAHEGDAEKPNEVFKPVNLLQSRFDVHQEKGKFVVAQTVQGQEVPWWGYQNLFVTKDGRQTMEIAKRQFKSEDFVPVKTGETIELVKAKNLDVYKAQRQFVHYGEKTLVGVMDAAMVATATVELGAIYKGTRMLQAATEVATKTAASMSQKELAREGVKSGIRLAAGLSGVLNSAGGRDFAQGETINNVRSAYFLGDIAQGLGRGGIQKVASLVRDTPKTIGSAEKLQAIIKGGNLNGEEILASSAWISKPYEWGHMAFKGTEWGYAPIIAHDLKDIHREISSGAEIDHLESALQQAGDGHGLKKGSAGDFDMHNALALDGARELIGDFQKGLTKGKSKAVSAEINNIFDETKRALSPEVSKEERTAIIQKLAAAEFFNVEQIQELEHQLNEHDGDKKEYPRLSGEDLERLYGQVYGLPTTGPRNESLIKLASAMLDKRDIDVSAARKIALLYLSRDENGQLQKTTKTSMIIPGLIHSYHDDATTTTQTAHIPPSTVTHTLNPQNMVQSLKRDLYKSNPENPRNIVTGDVLTRVGAITHRQYGAVLQDLLTSSHVSTQDKLDALCVRNGARLVNIIDGMQKEEAVRAIMAQATNEKPPLAPLGTAAEDFLRALKQVASNPREAADVRAMSAFAAFGLDETHLPARKAILEALGTVREKRANDPAGTIARDLQLTLENRVAAGISDSLVPSAPSDAHQVPAEVKLNATHCLELVADKKNEQLQSKLSESYAACLQSSSANARTSALNHLLYKNPPENPQAIGAVSSPSRLQELARTSPELADVARESCLGHLDVEVQNIKNQRDGANAKAVADLVRTMPEILEGSSVEQRLKCKDVAENCLKEKSGKEPAYASRVRVAAIQTLVGINSRDSIDLLRQFTVQDGNLQIGDQLKLTGSGEKSASVRATALAALEGLKDPLLNPLLTALDDKETNQLVRRQIANLEARNAPIGNDASRKSYIEALQTPLDRAEYGYLKDFNDGAQKRWIAENFPTLDQAVHEKNLKEKASGAMWQIHRLVRSTAAAEQAEFEAVKPLRDARNKEWDTLCNLAKQDSQKGNEAKAVLNGIILRQGNPLAALGDGSVKRDGLAQLDISSAMQWELKAVRALVACTEHGVGGRDLAVHYLKTNLTTNGKLHEHARLQLLAGWNKNLAPTKPLDFVDNDQANLSEAEYFQVLSDALLLERKRDVTKSFEFEDTLRKTINSRPNQAIKPLLHAIEIIDDAKKTTKR